jgi:uncharacterized protein (DUF433 family)
MADTVLSIDMIVSNPDIRGGRPIIKGTTLRVQDIAEAHRFQNYTPDEMAYQFQITLAQVHAALAYYFDHRNEIDSQIEADLQRFQQAKAEGLGQRHPPLLG